MVSIDGIGAFDVVSRQSMLEGVLTVEGGDSAMLFVLQFYGSAFSYWWEDEEGVAQVPALFSLGRHLALQAVQAQLQDVEVVADFSQSNFGQSIFGPN